MSFLPFLLIGWMLFTLLGEEGGLSEAYQVAFGPLIGKGITIIYMVWALLILCAEGRLYAERILVAGYHEVPPWVFLLALLGIVWWMAGRKLAAFVRATEICYLVLGLALALVLAFPLLDIVPEHVLPIWFSDLPSVALTTAVPVGVLSCGIFAAFLGQRVTRRPDDRMRGLRWLAAGCVVITLLQFACLSQLGAELCVLVDIPFFEVALGAKVDGAIQRIESAIMALWAFSDFALLGMLIFSFKSMAVSVFGERAQRGGYVGIILAFFGAFRLFPDEFAVSAIASSVIPAGNLVLALPIPALALVVRRVKRGKGTAAHLVNEGEEKHRI